MGKREQSTSNCDQIAFIACSKTKKQYACKARYLYQGALFQKALRYAERNYSQVYILSAKYGVLHPDDIIKPYEKTLSKMSKQDVLLWYDLIHKQMIERKLIGEKIFFTGVLYNKPFDGEKPLLGLSLGKQLRWFNQRNENYSLL